MPVDQSPKFLNILGYQYSLSMSSDEDDPRTCAAVFGGLGRIRCSRQRLEIANDLHPQQMLSTILHEVIEALNFHGSLHLKHAQIAALESGLFQVLTENGVDLNPLWNI